MIRDLATEKPAALPGYDVCIVGSGPAGGTLAAELARSGLSVCVLESGRARVTARGDALRRVVSEGIRIKDYSRERVLGGASSTWAGLSSPLDEIDLAPRPWMRLSGWPIARAELLGWYEEAAERYRFPRLAAFESGGASGFGALRARGDLVPDWPALDEKVFLACAEPQHFGRELRAAYEGSVDLWLDATVEELERAGSPDRVVRARVRAGDGRVLALAARAYVLATGGIENARLLLLSRGLGNERDQVGRYLMNHPKNYGGVLRLARPVESLPYYFGCLFEGFAGYAGVRLPPRVQTERGLLDSYARFEPLFPWTGSQGVESLVAIAKRTKLALKAVRARARGGLVELRDYSETGDDSDLQNERKGAAGWLGLGWNVIADAPRVSAYAWSRAVARRRPPVRAVRLRNFMEMEPDPENRVTLAREVDVDGRPLPLVRHRCTALDRRSLVALHETLARELARAGIGELEGALVDRDPWPIDQDASHHMGTTRMGDDPAQSVVDPTSRLHEVENVYLAGASVFPTSGCANPTFTIVALAIRLARHLERALGAPAALGTMIRESSAARGRP
jgi:choline dehydrogenase-like flavoprotein